MDRNRRPAGNGGTERDFPLYRAHAVQRLGNAFGGRHRESGRFYRRESGCLHCQGTSQLQHEGHRRPSSARVRRTRRLVLRPLFQPEEHGERKGRDSRRTEDGSGQSGVPGPRDVLPNILEEPSARGDRFWARRQQFSGFTQDAVAVVLQPGLCSSEHRHHGGGADHARGDCRLRRG